MGKRNWTAAQLSAIEYRGRNLLVSAAAGSGKTATLTERIIRLITDEDTHADISRMLVVTFTKAAASELRERVTGALGEASAADPGNTRLSEQLSLVGGAMICTMDSFFLSCVKPMFAKVGLPSDFRIGDKAELESLREEAMSDTVGFFFDSPDEEREEAILAIAESVASARTEDGLDDELLSFEAELGSVGIGEAELFAYADELTRISADDIMGTHHGRCIIDEVIAVAGHYRDLAGSLAEVMQTEDGLESYVSSAYEMKAYCESITDAAENGELDRLKALLGCVPKLPIRSKVHTNESEMFKSEKSVFTKLIGKLYSGYFCDDAAVRTDVMRKTASICRVAGEIIGEFRRRYGELKRRRGITDYSDVARMAAELIATPDGTPTPYGETVAARFDYVFIDEYQDTSIYQDRVFSAVASKCGRFMVGDIKQSIYRFRGGEPAVFTGYREAWKDGGDGETVFMSENFRCAENVTEFVNAVSRYMFPYGHIPFEEGDLLVHGRSEAEGATFDPVEVCLIERPGKQTGKDDDASADTDADGAPIPPGLVIECEYIAGRIRHMLDHETLPDGSPVRAKDIAVMYRSGKDRREVLAKALEKYNIPVNDGEVRQLFEFPEIQLLMCILKAVDNPTGDVYLAGAMYSSVFGFTLGEIALINDSYRKSGDKGCLWDALRYAASEESAVTAELQLKCRRVTQTLSEYRSLSRTLAAHAFIYRLIHDPAVANTIEDEGGAGAADRAMQFYELARGRDLSLYDFLGYADHVEKKGMEASEPSTGEGVSIMTIHHSKGLEFPVCFLMDATKAYSTRESKKSMFLDRSFGVAMRLPDECGLVKCDNILRRLAIFRALRENAFEEMRLLYVAMTRAREKLIVTGITNSPEKLLGASFMNAKFSGEYTVLSKKNYMGLILEALNLYGGKFASVVTVPYGDADEASVIVGDVSDCEVTETSDVSLEAEKLQEMLRVRTDFVYPYEHLRNIPSKLTVSKLYPEILDEFDDGAAVLEDEDIAEPSVPKFMLGTKYSPTDAGSAAHVFLQFCDFERLRDLGVEAELSRLVDEGFMSKADGDAANLEYIEAFRRSEFFGRILSAVEVRREFRFNAAVPAATLTGDAEKAALLEKDGTDVTVQGVIDIVFTDADGRLVLADYKTDRLTKYELEHKSAAAEKLWARHKKQLGYYAAVCEKIFGKSPDEVVIYSMPLGETV